MLIYSVFSLCLLQYKDINLVSDYYCYYVLSIFGLHMVHNQLNHLQLQHQRHSDRSLLCSMQFPDILIDIVYQIRETDKNVVRPWNHYNIIDCIINSFECTPSPLPLDVVQLLLLLYTIINTISFLIASKLMLRNRVSSKGNCCKPTPFWRRSATPRRWRTTTRPDLASSFASTSMPPASSPVLTSRLVSFFFLWPIHHQVPLHSKCN